MNFRILPLFILIVLSTPIFAQKSLKLDGINDFVQTNYPGVRGKNNRTFEAWVYIPSTAPSRNLVILDYGRNAVGSRNTFMVNSSRGLGYISGGTNANMSTSSNSIPTNKWVHVAFVLNNGTGYMYVNGVQLNSSNLSTVNTPTSGTYTNLRIGNRVPGGSNLYCDGQVDEVRIWSKALSQTEIRDWMCKEVNSVHPKYVDLEAYWKMDTLAGTNVADYSGNSRNGTATNGPVWQNFGAPVGTASIQSYTAISSMSLVHPDGDSMTVTNVFGNPSAAHLYYRDGQPNHSTIPTGVDAFDSSRHWGIHFVNGSSPSANFNYAYLPNKHFQNQGACFNELLKRNSNLNTSWSIQSASNASGVFTVTSANAGEYLLGYAGGNVIISTGFNKDTVLACDGDTVSIQNSSTGLQYQWLLNSMISPNDTTASLEVVATGNYQLIVNSPTCQDTSNVIRVEFNSLPVVSFSALSDVCADQFSVTLQGGSPSGGNYSSPFLSGNLFIVSSAGPGKHKIIYEYTDSNQCSDTASQWIQVNALPGVTLLSKSPVCLDSLTHTLSGGSPAGGNYFVNGNPTSQFEPSTLGVGKHWVKYSYTDSNQCTGHDSIQADVMALPNVSLQLIKSRFCEYDDPWRLDGQNPRGGVFFGTGLNGLFFEPGTAGPGSHEISYRITDANTGCKNTATDTIQVHPRPSKPVIIAQGDSLTVTLNQDHRWYNLQGVIPGATGASFGPTEEGPYFVRVRNSEGCWSLNSDTVEFRFTSLIEVNENSSFRVYPVPARDQLFVENVNSGSYEMSLFDLNGRIVFHAPSIEEGNKTFDLSGLSPGVYTLQFSSQGSIQFSRLVIE